MEAIRVRVDGVSKRFAHRVKGEVYAARDVTLDVAPGEFLTLLGPSGCGKTTTLRMVAGFETPDAGRIRFGDDDVTHTPADKRNIGFVFQNYALFPHLQVAENVAYGLRVRGVAAAQIAEQVRDVLALVGLAGYEHQFSSQLSGGEQQRVALARAIVIKPRLLLFDEPLSNLDARLRVQMRDEIRDLQQRLAITTIYVTHDQEEAMAVSDRIVVMSQGRVVQDGSAEDLYHRPRTRFVAEFIGRVNLVAAQVVDIAPGVVTLAALDREMRVSHDGAGLRRGGSARLVLRPEALEIVRADDARAALEGVVTARSFLGEKVEYRVRCVDTSLQVVRHNSGTDDIVPTGMTIGLAIASPTAAVLPDDDE
ncbi:MAG: ABC transporter ATP-binding protein [Betaproteobacteria bacterium]